MIDSLNSAIALIFSPGVLGLVLAAIPLGLVFGILPGLGGLTALAIVIHACY